MTRLYHPDDLYSAREITLSDGQSHYLRNVLRATIGHRLAVFNERDGEWSAHVSTLTKNTVCITIEGQLRPATPGPDLTLMFAPIKHDPLTFLMEKATELGVRNFHPVMTERCNISRVNHERLQNNVIEAAQQCERFDVPRIHPMVSLAKSLSGWDATIPLFVCQERGDVPSITQSLRKLPPFTPAGFLIGPEGGFSPQEFAYLKSFSFTKNISLGPRILRAETASLAALTCYQAIVGDWGGAA